MQVGVVGFTGLWWGGAAVGAGNHPALELNLVHSLQHCYLVRLGHGIVHLAFICRQVLREVEISSSDGTQEFQELNAP